MAPPAEAWLRGPVPGIAPHLQPVAHALIQAREDVEALAPGLPAELLWKRQNGAASAGFHLLHLVGALDRLFTYARSEVLSDEQKAALRAESQDHPETDGTALAALVAAQIDRALRQVGETDASRLLDGCRIGRAGLPSNVMGVLFHAAEHTTRHVGQFISTSTIVR
jgi:uncharacterized damage-inducible protein DinB